VSLAIKEYLLLKNQCEAEITAYLIEKKEQFQKETGLEVQDIFIYTSDVTSFGDNEPKFIITNTSIRTKLSD
jgi:hypothetical protein